MPRTGTNSYAYCVFVLLQRLCDYAYDTIALPYIANTYATATTSGRGRV